jgi:hypothetical protein
MIIKAVRGLFDPLPDIQRSFAASQLRTFVQKQPSSNLHKVTAS